MGSESGSRKKVAVLVLVLTAAVAVGAWQLLASPGDTPASPEQAVLDKSERMKAQVKAQEDRANRKARPEAEDTSTETTSGPQPYDG